MVFASPGMCTAFSQRDATSCNVALLKVENEDGTSFRFIESSNLAS